MRLVFDIRGLHDRGSLGQRWIGLDIVAIALKCLWVEKAALIDWRCSCVVALF